MKKSIYISGQDPVYAERLSLALAKHYGSEIAIEICDEETFLNRRSGRAEAQTIFLSQLSDENEKETAYRKESEMAGGKGRDIAINKCDPVGEIIKAIDEVLGGDPTCMSGGAAGSGKTTTTGILDILRHEGCLDYICREAGRSAGEGRTLIINLSESFDMLRLLHIGESDGAYDDARYFPGDVVVGMSDRRGARYGEMNGKGGTRYGEMSGKGGARYGEMDGSGGVDGFERFILDLRGSSDVAAAPPHIVRLDGGQGFAGDSGKGLFYLKGPQNPQVIYELTETDLKQFMDAVRKLFDFKNIIWLVDSLIPGIRALIQLSTELIVLKKEGAVNECRTDKLLVSLKRLGCLDKDSLRLVNVDARPDCKSGRHLMYRE